MFLVDNQINVPAGPGNYGRLWFFFGGWGDSECDKGGLCVSDRLVWLCVC